MEHQLHTIPLQQAIENATKNGPLPLLQFGKIGSGFAQHSYR